MYAFSPLLVLSAAALSAMAVPIPNPSLTPVNTVGNITYANLTAPSEGVKLVQFDVEEGAALPKRQANAYDRPPEVDLALGLDINAKLLGDMRKRIIGHGSVDEEMGLLGNVELGNEFGFRKRQVGDMRKRINAGDIHVDDQLGMMNDAEIKAEFGF